MLVALKTIQTISTFHLLNLVNFLCLFSSNGPSNVGAPSCTEEERRFLIRVCDQRVREPGKLTEE
jgi:hypothetical protein